MGRAEKRSSAPLPRCKETGRGAQGRRGQKRVGGVGPRQSNYNRTSVGLCLLDLLEKVFLVKLTELSNAAGKLQSLWFCRKQFQSDNVWGSNCQSSYTRQWSWKMKKGLEHRAVVIGYPVAMGPADHQPSSAGGWQGSGLCMENRAIQPHRPPHLHPLWNVCAFDNNHLLPVELICWQGTHMLPF